MRKEVSLKKRGGKREGAGRKAVYSVPVVRVTIPACILPDVLKLAENYKL